MSESSIHQLFTTPALSRWAKVWRASGASGKEEIPGEERARRAVPFMQNLRFDLSLTVGHAEAHPRHAGVFLDPVRQGLRMRGNPELNVFQYANDQVRQGIHNVRMQARLRFVDCQ